jgi:hypothetical protein
MTLNGINYKNFSPCSFIQVEPFDSSVTLLDGFLDESPCFLHKTKACQPELPKDPLSTIKEEIERNKKCLEKTIPNNWKNELQIG